MYILAAFVWLASCSKAAFVRGGRQNLTHKDSAAQAVSTQGWVNSSGWANSTRRVNSTQKALPMEACPVGGIFPDKQELTRDMSAGVVLPLKSLTGYEAKVEAVRKVVQRGMKLKPAEQAMPPPEPTKTSVHEYVFITGVAYTGTTSLYGLLSTSPQTSNLCAGFGNCCEGAPILEKAGLWPISQVSNPAYPLDWKQSLAIYSKYWNMSKPILIEKSVGNMNRFPRLYQTVRSMGAKASFIYLVRSTCFFKHNHYPGNGWLTGMNEVLQSAQYLRNLGAKVLIIKWEDVVGDPYGVSRELLKFLPELVSLDPTKVGLHDASKRIFTNFAEQ